MSKNVYRSVAPRRFYSARRGLIWLLMGMAGFIPLMVSQGVQAACTTGSSSAECVGTVNNTASIGTGPVVPDNNWTVTIGNGTTPTMVTQNGNTVISLNDNANITVKSGAVVQGSSSGSNGGHFGSGPNVIEFNSNSTVTIEEGGTVQQLGTTNNGEAINAHGYGNTIVNNGTIYSKNGAALWFQDTTVSASTADRNKVVNNGTISTDKGAGYNVFGSSRGSSGPGLVFNNYGTVNGSLKFGDGDDSLLFGPGSVITGNVDGGRGTNDLTLDANLNESATLGGSVLNFSSITKTGQGSWAILGGVPASDDDEHPSSPISGSLKGVNSLVVQEGLLSLVGANPEFNGTVSIDAPGILNVQAQGINGATSMVNNGNLTFEQPSNDSYTGSAITGTGQVVKSGAGSLTMSSNGDNTYSGGTSIRDGALVVDRDSDLGVATGAVSFGTDNGAGATNGILRFDSSFDLADTRAIDLKDGGGTIDTQQYETTIAQTISGSGVLTKTGSGTLTLSGVNSYAGGTVIEEGTVGINSDAALGRTGSHLVMQDTSTLRLDANVESNRTVILAGVPDSEMTIDTQANNGTFDGDIQGRGKLVKTGTGTLALYGDNIYQGGTRVEEGTLAVNSDAALGSVVAPLELWDKTTLRLDGNTDMQTRPISIGGGGNPAPQSVTIDTQNFTGTIGQNIAESADGATRLDKTGTGVLELYGNNAHSGGTWIKNGTVAILSASGLGTGDAQLGDHDDSATGGTGDTMGSLRADADINFAAGQAVLLNQGGGTIDTNGHSVMMADNTLKDGTTTGVAPDTGRDFHKDGDGTLTLLNDQLYSGRTFIDQGTLRLDAVDPNAPMSNSKGLLNTSQVTIASGARLEGQGVVGNSMNDRIGNPDAPAAGSSAFTTIINNGTIAPGLDNFNNAFDQTNPHFVPLTLAGNYRAGAGAMVEVHTELMDDTSRHGMLVIDGVVDPASDANGTGIRVIHQGGDGATTNHGIEIIRLQGTGSGLSQADLVKQLGDNFHLVSDFKTAKGENAVVAGAYSYVLEKDVDWYGDATNQAGLFLRNAMTDDGTPVLHPGTPTYESYLPVLGALNRLPTLEQRVGHRVWLEDSDSKGTGTSKAGRGAGKAGSRGVWVRLEGSTAKYKPELGSGGDNSFDLNYGRANVGLDVPVYENRDGSRLVAGINGNAGKAKADIHSSLSDGDIDTDAYGLGATLTWYDHSGFYADFQAKYNWYDTDMSVKNITSASHAVKGNNARGYAFSLEMGQNVDFAPNWSLTPQAQLMYSQVNFDSFVDPQYSVIVNEKDYKSLEGRLGLALNYEKSEQDSLGRLSRDKLYVIGNVYHEFKGDSTISISGVNYKSNLSDTWLGIGVGGSHNWNNDKYSVYGELGAKSSTRKFGDEYELTAEVGLRIAF